MFQAFKELEIRVRSASSLSQELIGTELMRSAFHLGNGKLTDITRPKAERDATGHLFAGAIGLFKNSSSHRDVNWDEPIECAELIYLANHLLRMVNKRARDIL
ncbi:TIGR02391 family protein [Chloroflexota bacterium]